MFPVSLNKRLPRRKLLASLLLTLLLGLLAVGCSSKKGTVSGKVTYNGKPLTKGMVTFLPESGQGGAFSSPIKEDGTYMVSGVPAGKMKIAVVPARVQNKTAMTPQAGKSENGQVSETGKKIMPRLAKKFAGVLEAPKGPSSDFPSHYSNPEKSGLEFTVTGGSETHDIELK
jgi:hypothetical protein